MWIINTHVALTNYKIFKKNQYELQSGYRVKNINLAPL